MGLYKIDNASREEWERQARRRHEVRQWLITLAEIGAMAAMVLIYIWLIRWLDI